MAGPGGGPPRRSHTKSRKGCESCKRRHIRCDENFPQCKNCTKHKVRCPYNDQPIPDERAATPDKPNLMWTPEIEATIEQWQRTGAFPFPSLNIYPAPVPQYYTVEELRLIHHLASICDKMSVMDANGFTLWTRQIPIIIRIGATNAYVMHALLAFSAEHIAFQTNCPQVGALAFEHRDVAFKGVKEAITSFSPETSDAILAASLVLSWQASDWRAWTQLMQGTSTIIEAMEEWWHTSQLGDFIAESSTFPTAPPSPSPDHKPNQPRKEDLDAFQRTLTQLSRVDAHLKQNKEDSQLVQQLVSFLKGAKKVVSIQSIEAQFDRLRPLRTWLFWLPVMCLEHNGPSTSALLVIAHYYTAAIIMERLFPEIGAAYFGSLSIGPVEEIARRLFSINVSGMNDSSPSPSHLMEYPMEVISQFRSRMGLVQPAQTSPFPQVDSPGFYMSDDFQHGTPSSSASVPVYSGNQPFGYSAENLPMLVPEVEPPSAVSPVTIPSPYLSQQYLNVPSPLFGGYSPTSSTHEDFAWSERDDSPLFDMGATGHPTCASAGPSNFGVGFVSPIQSAVWISSAQQGAPSSSRLLPLNGSTASPSTFTQSTAFYDAPSPFLNPHQWTVTTPRESMTPLSSSAPSPIFMPPEHFMHHRQSASISSAPFQFDEHE